MDAKVKAVLNKFSETQPGLQVSGAPASKAIRLGDVIDAPGTQAANVSTAAAATVALVDAKVNAVIAALIAAGLMLP